ncbi:unnamed protein product [Acanthocheilonema viteae]|uniref:Uncharacterized protein n=1 Tax=Acanthocheilonema viteae TaxID=6277 RepID=A0A498T1X7_ACAVI|nr:unnamed protein product [Acanthocheilonema viteae]
MYFVFTFQYMQIQRICSVARRELVQDLPLDQFQLQQIRQQQVHKDQRGRYFLSVVLRQLLSQLPHNPLDFPLVPPRNHRYLVELLQVLPPLLVPQLDLVLDPQLVKVLLLFLFFFV